MPDDQRVELAPERYLARLGTIVARFDQQDSGNVSYGVEADGVRRFVKTAGRPDDDRHLSYPERVAVLRNAIRLARAYRHPALPELRQVIETFQGPMLVYDWAPGELLGTDRRRRQDPASAFQRFRGLPVASIVAALDTIVGVHRLLGEAGEVAVDFYDGCLIYDFATGQLSIVDLDHYSPDAFRNVSGRMLGSSRFMAPEEFTLGAWIDQRTSVYTLGRTILVFLGDGTTTPAAFRGPAPLLQVALRACQPAPELRYASVAEFSAAWRDARRASS